MLRSQHRCSRIFLPPLLKLQRKITTVRSAGGSLASQLQPVPTKRGFLVLGGGGEKQEEATRRDLPRPGPPVWAWEAARGAWGLLLAAGGRRQRLRFAGSRSVASSSAARDLPPGTLKRESQGSSANSRREWMQGGGGERARRGEGKGKNRAQEPDWQPRREERRLLRRRRRQRGGRLQLGSCAPRGGGGQLAAMPAPGLDC